MTQSISIKNSVYLILLSALVTVGTTRATTHQQSTSSKVSVYYPTHYQAKPHQPSFALIDEARVKRATPRKGCYSPHFYEKEGKTIASIALQKGMTLYGTGEVTGPLARNGKSITLWNSDNYKYASFGGKQLYQSHPWVLGVKRDGSAIGWLADNTWRQSIELTDSIRFISDGPAFRIIVIEGVTPQEVAKQLAKLTGKIEMPPLWALGYQQCRFSYVPDSRIKSVADTFRLKKIPCDVIWMDIDYMDNFKVFTFDKEKIPDPKAINDYLHAKGFKSIWMIDPGIKKEIGYPIYDSGAAGDHWVKTAEGEEFNGKVWPGICAFPDFTRPETQRWWSGHYTQFMATGIDGVWNDMNEPSVFDGPEGSMPQDNWHRGGGRLQADKHLRYHNVYGMLMVKASREGILKSNPDKRPFILSRSGYLGSQRYAATWTGDNASTEEHMKLSIPMSLNLSLSGQPFNGPDLGGFIGDCTPELFGQWVSFGVFFPFVRGHAANDANQKEPWAFGKAIEEVSRTAISRRYRLLPYYYTLFHEAATTGLPVMRPLFYSDPQDSALRKEDQSFLIGNDLWVRPKWATTTYTPKGEWHSISLVGENSSTDYYQADVKLRRGALIPTCSTVQNTTEYRPELLSLLIYFDAKGIARGTLYEDAGDGFGYKKGEYALTEYEAQKLKETITIKAIHKAGKSTSTAHFKTITVVENGIQYNYRLQLKGVVDKYTRVSQLK